MTEKQQSDKKVKREFALSSLSVDNRTSIIILTFLIVFMGVSAYISMPKESFPEIVIPTIYIGTPYSGNSPVDIENLVTRPIEKELKTINGIKDIKSTSIQDFSTIIVEFNPEIPVDEALQDTKDAVDKAKSELPRDLDTDPNVFEINFSEFPIMNINISGDYSPDDLKKYAEYLKDEIEILPEISKAEIKGAREREIRIDADIYKMDARMVSFSDISNAIKSENLTLSGGDLRVGDFRRSLRVIGEFKNVSQLDSIIVKNENQSIVYLKDVADVSDAYEERKSYARSNKLPVVTLDIVKRSGENILDAADEIKEIIDKAKKDQLPSDLDIFVTNDLSKATRSQVDNLENNIIFGVILVVLILMFFLGLRNALFVGVAIPMSMFIAFLILNALGVTLNMMVLFSLILALGMLVDNGIVVVENIYRLLQEGYSLTKAAKEGVGEVAWPIITSTATTLAAFLPLAFWGGIIGEFMKYLPITLIIVLSSSLFVALVINPVLTAMFMKLEQRTEPNRKRTLIITAILFVLAILLHLAGVTGLGNLLALFAFLIPVNVFLVTKAVKWFQTKLLSSLENVYYKFIKFALSGKKPYLFFFGTIGLLFFSIIFLGIRQPKVTFFPDNEPNYINIFIEKPIGADIENTNTFTKRVEDEIITMMKPYAYMIESIIGKVGAGASDPNQGVSQQATPNKGMITVAFVEYQYRKGKNTTEILEEIREAMEKYPGVRITVDKEQNGPPVGKPINIEVSGENYEKLISYTEDIITEINNANIEGIEELKTDLEIGKPELIVEIDRDKATRFGLSTATIAQDLRTALFGEEVSEFKEGEDEYPIQLRVQPDQRYNIDALINKGITFRNKRGQLVQIPISSVATIKYSSTYGSIRRIDQKRVITIFSNVNEGYNANEINQEIKTLLSDFEKPGFKISFTGEQEQQAESMAFLGKAMLIAVGLIFLIIVAQFNSMSAPFIIMMSVVLSTIGVFLGLASFNMDFVVIMTGIGIISLAGVVVNNAIVLIDYTNLVRKRRLQELNLSEQQTLPIYEVMQCIMEAGKTRLRPVLLTAVTTVLGLVPMALGTNIDFFSLFSHFDPQFYMGGDNADFWGPMAWTVIFGLVFATFLTLVVVPVMYLLAEKLKRKITKK